jgi:type III pantothenate kinase
MFLSIDAGNSNIVFGFYELNTNSWVHEFRFTTQREVTAFQLEKALHLFLLENGLKVADISEIGFSSVVPEINAVIEQLSLEFFGKPCYLINGSSYDKLPVSTLRPNEIGTDLMCNVMAAYERTGTATIIVDFGTALTFTVVGPTGSVIGVNILPGLQTAIKSLFSNTSKLPEVPLVMPASAIGKNTVHSIQAGIIFGYTGLVKGMLQTIQKELGYNCKIVATGGLSRILTNLQEEFDLVDKKLTLEGIRLITIANKS